MGTFSSVSEWMKHGDIIGYTRGKGNSLNILELVSELHLISVSAPLSQCNSCTVLRRALSTFTMGVSSTEI
jgi:hypothetical protein